MYSRTAQHSPLHTSQEKQRSDFVMNPHTDVSALGLVVCSLLKFKLPLHCMLWLPVDIVPAIICCNAASIVYYVWNPWPKSLVRMQS